MNTPRKDVTSNGYSQSDASFNVDLTRKRLLSWIKGNASECPIRKPINDAENERRFMEWHRKSLDHVEQHGACESFSQWLDSHGDSLPLPKDFSEWLDQNQDTIIQ